MNNLKMNHENLNICYDLLKMTRDNMASIEAEYQIFTETEAMKNFEDILTGITDLMKAIKGVTDYDNI